jgi:hypothetical protein
VQEPAHFLSDFRPASKGENGETDRPDSPDFLPDGLSGIIHKQRSRGILPQNGEQRQDAAATNRAYAISFQV